MNLSSTKKIKSLCQKYHFWPQRKSGQNFLVDEKTLAKIIDAANLNPDDIILEIGAGFGVLTFALAPFVKKIIAVELDKRLVRALGDLLALQNFKNIEIFQGDIFKQWSVVSRQLTDLKYKLVSNLPYNITSLILRNFLEQKQRPSKMTLLMQKEVAQRVVAKPGEMSLLSVACQFYGEPKIISCVSRENFWPSPEVDSAILSIKGIGMDIKSYQRLLGNFGDKKFFSLVKIGFTARRKQLQNNLAAGLGMDNQAIKNVIRKCGLDIKIRAQDLSINDWINLAKNI